ncbi:thiamine pyrophosphate-binding protein [Roseobacter sp. HKCC-CH-9208]|uniref:thiamine pyrophosphate-binding protein n=1 Tax=Roseobacter sp. HKCC-CH-9208 TaxID=3120339 RepID=UPI0030EC7E90
MNVAEYIASRLVELGIDTCFTVTGGGAMFLNDAFGHCSDLRVIYCHNETAAAIAAEGYARVNYKPALVCVTSGPGAVNAIPGVYGAWQDAIPMFVVSGQMRSDTLSTSTSAKVRYLAFQESNIISLCEPITKYSMQIKNASEVSSCLEEAYGQALSGKMGPVWLDIPVDIQSSPMANYSNLSAMDRISAHTNTNLERKADELVTLLKRSKKPVLMFGEEIRMQDCVSSALQLAECLNIPVVTEWNAHDQICDDHSNYAGRPGTIGNRGGNFTVQDCDLLIALGCQLSIRQISYNWQSFAKNAKLCYVTCDSAELDKPTIHVDLAVLGSIEDFCSLVISNVNTPRRCWDEWNSWCHDRNIKYSVTGSVLNDEAGFVSSYEFFRSLSEQLPTRSVTTLANGAACVVGLQSFVVKQNTRVFTNAGASSMGYGIASALGAAAFVNSENVPTVCVEGDGSIMMNLQELQTIITNKLNIKIFILNNNGYHSIRQTQKNMFSAETRGFCGADPTSGLELPNFEKISAAFEITYKYIKKQKDINKIVNEVLKLRGPVVCEVYIDPDEDFKPKLMSKLLDDGTFSTPELEDMYPFLSKEEIEKNKFKLK